MAAQAGFPDLPDPFSVTSARTFPRRRQRRLADRTNRNHWMPVQDVQNEIFRIKTITSIKP